MASIHVFFFQKHVNKKHEAQIPEILRNKQETLPDLYREIREEEIQIVCDYYVKILTNTSYVIHSTFLWNDIEQNLNKVIRNKI